MLKKKEREIIYQGTWQEVNEIHHRRHIVVCFTNVGVSRVSSVKIDVSLSETS